MKKRGQHTEKLEKLGYLINLENYGENIIYDVLHNKEKLPNNSEKIHKES